MAGSDATRAAVEKLLDALGEQDARAVLSEAGRRSSQLELERVITRRLAVRLLEARAPRWQIRDRLVARGIHWRTAYRVIDAALAAPVTCSVSDGPDLSIGLRTLGVLQPLESELATTIEEMKADLARLQAERAGINLSAARRAADAAEAARETNQEAIRAALKEGDFGNAAHAKQSEVATLARQCRLRAQGDERRAAALDCEIQRLSDMINAEARVAAAIRAAALTGELVASAAQQLAGAEAALRKVEEMVQAEERVYDQSRASAAAQLLAAVKAGGDTSQVPAASRDKVSTWEIARIEAQQELEAAKAALQAAKASHAAAEQAIQVAKAGAAALAHELAFSTYVESLAAYMAAHSRARLGMFSCDDARMKASQLAQKLLEA